MKNYLKDWSLSKKKVKFTFILKRIAKSKTTELFPGDSSSWGHILQVELIHNSEKLPTADQVVQEVLLILITDHGWTDSHCEYSAHIQNVQLRNMLDNTWNFIYQLTRTALLSALKLCFGSRDRQNYFSIRTLILRADMISPSQNPSTLFYYIYKNMKAVCDTVPYTPAHAYLSDVCVQ